MNEKASPNFSLGTTLGYIGNGDYDIYIGRKNPSRGLQGSKWANPFAIKRGRTREQAIELYRQHILESPKLLAELEELRGKRLACWCAPKACHGDVLLELLGCTGQGQEAQGTSCEQMPLF